MWIFNLIAIAFGCVVVAAEIIVDKKVFWANLKNDKPITTILRVIPFLLLGIVYTFIDVGMAVRGVLLSYATFFMLFDWTLNCSRWDELPRPYWWKLSHLDADELTWFDYKIGWPLRVFLAKFFYHAQPKPKPERVTFQYYIDNGYELFWQRIPPQMELLVKILPFVSVLIY